MENSHKIQIFNGQKVRSVWDEEEEKWYFSIVDVIEVLTDSANPQTYWRVLKKRLKDEGNETVTNCNALKMLAPDGKLRLTDVADQQQLFRIIQSIPSPKAEPFKQWMALVASNRLDQMQDPELDIEQAILDYKRLGYDDKWINQRIRTIEIRKGLTDEWKRGGITEHEDFALLTDLMSKTWSGMTTKEYKQLKGLKKENLRDNMTNLELLLNAIAEETATQISKERNPEGLRQNAVVAKEGADVAKSTRDDIEHRLGHTIISSERAINHINPEGTLPLNEAGPFAEE